MWHLPPGAPGTGGACGHCRLLVAPTGQSWLGVYEEGACHKHQLSLPQPRCSLEAPSGTEQTDPARAWRHRQHGLLLPALAWILLKLGEKELRR